MLSLVALSAVLITVSLRFCDAQGALYMTGRHSYFAVIDPNAAVDDALTASMVRRMGVRNLGFT